MNIDPNDYLNKVETTILPRDQVISILYQKSRSVQEYCRDRDDARGDKYVELALKFNYTHYRICTVSDLFDWGLLASFSKFAREFVNDSGLLLVVFNVMADKPLSIVLKKINKKEFLDFSIYTGIYGLDLISSDFRYGDYLLVTEGIYDADSFRHLYKNVVSVMTSTVSIMQSEVLTSITDKFLFAFDSDEAGIGGYYKAEARMRSLNKKIKVGKLDIFTGDKDLGNMEEYILRGDQSKYNNRFLYYKGCLGVLTEELLY